jgi:hypothetical protein
MSHLRVQEQKNLYDILYDHNGNYVVIEVELVNEKQAELLTNFRIKDNKYQGPAAASPFAKEQESEKCIYVLLRSLQVWLPIKRPK